MVCAVHALHLRQVGLRFETVCTAISRLSANQPIKQTKTKQNTTQQQPTNKQKQRQTKTKQKKKAKKKQTNKRQQNTGLNCALQCHYDAAVRRCAGYGLPSIRLYVALWKKKKVEVGKYSRKRAKNKTKQTREKQYKQQTRTLTTTNNQTCR